MPVKNQQQKISWENNPCETLLPNSCNTSWPESHIGAQALNCADLFIPVYLLMPRNLATVDLCIINVTLLYDIKAVFCTFDSLC